MPQSLIVFIKNIIPGRVKTRLAATVGDERAVEIYRALLERTRTEVGKVEAERYVFYSSFVEENDDWSAEDFKKMTQRGEGIGERMAHAFEDIMPPGKKAVLVGGDIAGLTAEILQTGLEKLDDYDFVLGPAHDGGYYLIGMKEPMPEVFKNIHWSTDQVARQTLDRIRSMHKTCFLLPVLADIDYEEDWERYGFEL